MLEDVLTRYFEKQLGISLSDLNQGELRVCPSARRANPDKDLGYTIGIWGIIFEDKGVLRSKKIGEAESIIVI